MKNKYHHFMIDIETWGLSPGCAIRSVAVLDFTKAMNTGDTSSLARAPSLHLATVDEAGHRLPETVKWWDQQPAEAREHFEHLPQTTVAGAVKALGEFAEANSGEYDQTFWWSKDPDFDKVVIEQSPALHGLPLPLKRPWHYRDWAACRTLDKICRMLDVETGEVPDYGTAHNALNDCRYQAHTVVAKMSTLNGLLRG